MGLLNLLECYLKDSPQACEVETVHLKVTLARGAGCLWKMKAIRVRYICCSADSCAEWLKGCSSLKVLKMDLSVPDDAVATLGSVMQARVVLKPGRLFSFRHDRSIAFES